MGTAAQFPEAPPKHGQWPEGVDQLKVLPDSPLKNADQIIDFQRKDKVPRVYYFGFPKGATQGATHGGWTGGATNVLLNT